MDGENSERRRNELLCLPAVMRAVDSLDARSRFQLLLYASYEAGRQLLEEQLAIPEAWTKERHRQAQAFRVMAGFVDHIDLGLEVEQSAREGSLTSRRDWLYDEMAKPDEDGGESE